MCCKVFDVDYNDTTGNDLVYLFFYLIPTNNSPLVLSSISVSSANYELRVTARYSYRYPITILFVFLCHAV
jgi:hypothetical protein